MCEKKGFIFARVSTSMQDYTMQIDKLKGKVREKEYDVSAYKESALSYGEKQYKEELISAIESGKYSTIYAFDITRLGRIQSIIHTISEVAEQNKVNIYLYNDGNPIELFNERFEKNSTWDLIFSIMATTSSIEMKLKKSRMKAGKEHLRRKGIYVGGYIPYGYCVCDETKLYTINEEEAKIIREIYSLYENNSISEITSKLYEFGVALKGSLIHKILKNEAYTGREYTSKYGNVVSYPKIIEPELFDRVKVLRSDRKRDNHKYIHYSKKVLFCSECGRKTGVNKVSYCCPNATRGGRLKKLESLGKYVREPHNKGGLSECNNKNTISINVIDSILFSVARNIQRLVNVEDIRKAKEEKENEINELKKKLLGYNVSKEKLQKEGKDIENDEELTPSQKRSLFKDLNRKIKDIDNNIAIINADIERLYSNIDNLESHDTTEPPFGNLVGRVIIKENKLVTDLKKLEDESVIDKYRKEIVERYISKVFVTNTLFPHKLKTRNETKMVKARKIKIISSFMKNYIIELVYIPNIGVRGINNNIWLRVHPFFNFLFSKKYDEIEYDSKKYMLYQFQYLDRFRDPYKEKKKLSKL